MFGQRGTSIRGECGVPSGAQHVCASHMFSPGVLEGSLRVDSQKMQLPSDQEKGVPRYCNLGLE